MYSSLQFGQAVLSTGGKLSLCAFLKKAIDNGSSIHQIFTAYVLVEEATSA